jgi:hypothetical protein
MARTNHGVLITDIPARVVGGFKPAKGVGRGWVAIDYETDGLCGTGVATGYDSGAPELVLDLNLTGNFILYLALGCADNIRVWLDGEKGFREFTCGHGGHAFQECRLHRADLTGRRLHIAPVPVDPLREYDSHTFLGYIRAVRTDHAPKPTKASRTLVATNDGYSSIALHGLSRAEDISVHFTNFRDSDFYRVLYCPAGADVSGNHLTKVGTTSPFDTTHAYRRCDRQYAVTTGRVLKNGGDILQAAAAAAKDVGVEFHFYIRPEAFYCPFPYHDAFTSKFFAKNPQWRCTDEFGEEVMRMSYAFPQVQDHMLAYIQELLTYKPGGVCFAFNRSLPMMICEEPVLRAFEQKHGRRPRLPEEVDSPQLVAIRQTMLTTFMERVAALLKKHKAVLTCIADANHQRNSLMGLDLEALASRGLLESIYVTGSCLGVPYWEALRDRFPKIPILCSIHYPHEAGGESPDPYSHKVQAQALKKILDSGFAGMFWWDLDFMSNNPYNWHVLRHGGSRDFLERVLAEDPATKVKFRKYTKIHGVKRGRYDPMISY